MEHIYDVRITINRQFRFRKDVDDFEEATRALTDEVNWYLQIHDIADGTWQSINEQHITSEKEKS